MKWLGDNIIWLGPSVGALLVAVFGWLASRGNNRSRKQTQRAGDRSTNLQAGGDIRIRKMKRR